MARENTPFLMRLVVYMTWLCLSCIHPRLKSPLYEKYLPIQDVLAYILEVMPLSLAPGLQHILVSLNPPTILDLKRVAVKSNKILRHRLREIWAMYLVILEKRGCPPLVYIGSGTSLIRGARVRLRCYETGQMLSPNTRKAIGEGYEITSKGCLCWAPKPGAANAPVFRSVFLALESSLSFMLWAYKTKKDFGIPQMRLWDTEKFTYDGLCSHIALSEGIPGEHDLTPEERAAHEAELADRQKRLKNKSYRKIKAADPARFRVRVAANQRRIYQKNPEKCNAATKKSRSKNLATKKYHCDTCNMSFKESWKLERHVKSQSHRELAGLPKVPVVKDKWDLARDPVKFAATKKKTIAKAVANKKFYCAICDLACPDNSKLQRHFQTEKHINAAGLLQSLGVTGHL